MSVFNQYPYLNINDLNLDWIIAHFKEFIDDISALEAWRAVHEEQYNELLAFMNDLKNGVLPPAMYNAFKAWFDANAFDLVGEMVKFVFFGLTDDGYFVAYIPTPWDSIVFGTSGLDDFPAGVPYGHLTLTY